MSELDERLLSDLLTAAVQDVPPGGVSVPSVRARQRLIRQRWAAWATIGVVAVAVTAVALYGVDRADTSRPAATTTAVSLPDPVHPLDRLQGRPWMLQTARNGQQTWTAPSGIGSLMFGPGGWSAEDRVNYRAGTVTYTNAHLKDGVLTATATMRRTSLRFESAAAPGSQLRTLADVMGATLSGTVTVVATPTSMTLTSGGTVLTFSVGPGPAPSPPPPGGTPDLVVLCRDIPGQTGLNQAGTSSLVTVGAVRAAKLGAHGTTSTQLFPGASPDSPAAWCWIADPAAKVYHLWAAAGGYQPVYVADQPDTSTPAHNVPPQDP